MRKNFDEISKEAVFDETSRILKIDNKEIGYVYYRTGYQAEQYASEEQYLTRTMLECSMAIKCPSVDVHLTTFKKFQQAFQDRELLTRVMGDEESAGQIAPLFSGCFGLEDLGQKDAVCTEIVDKAIKDPHLYVLKPQKEGGGNNFFDEDIPRLLLDQSMHQELRTYLLMERIFPPTIKAWQVRNGELSVQNCLSEFGIYSSLFVNTGEKPLII